VNGTDISAVWLGDVVDGSFGREIRRRACLPHACRRSTSRCRVGARISAAGRDANPVLPSPPVLLAASLARLGQLDEARVLVADYLRRSPRYKATDIGIFLRESSAAYHEGRERVMESLRAAGMPWVTPRAVWFPAGSIAVGSPPPRKSVGTQAKDWVKDRVEVERQLSGVTDRQQRPRDQTPTTPARKPRAAGPRPC